MKSYVGISLPKTWLEFLQMYWLTIKLGIQKRASSGLCSGPRLSIVHQVYSSSQHWKTKNRKGYCRRVWTSYNRIPHSTERRFRGENRRNAPNSHRRATLQVVKIHFVLENLWISEPSLGVLEKFQHAWVLPNIIVHYYFLFNFIGYSFMLPNIFFLIDHHGKAQSELTDCSKTEMSKNKESVWSDLPLSWNKIS